MPGKVVVEGLSDILGGDFTKIDELVGKTFNLIAYETEQVTGYRTPVCKYTIELDGETKDYSSFSSVLLNQITQIEKAMKDQKIKFPIELSLRGAIGKKTGNAYLSFAVPNDGEVKVVKES